MTIAAAALVLATSVPSRADTGLVEAIRANDSEAVRAALDAGSGAGAGAGAGADIDHDSPGIADARSHHEIVCERP